MANVYGYLYNDTMMYYTVDYKTYDTVWFDVELSNVSDKQEAMAEIRTAMCDAIELGLV